MFHHNPTAVTVTPSDIYFAGKDPSALYFFDSFYERYSSDYGFEEPDITVNTDEGCYKFRHPNRIQTKNGKKIRGIIEFNFEAKKVRNRREHEHRSKEKKLLRAVA